jgi:hypothetical protein
VLERDFPSQLVAWHKAHVEAALRRGVTITVETSPDDGRSKSAAWVTAKSGEHESQLIVWTSGEADYVSGEPGLITANEHHELQDLDGLRALLERLIPDL